VKKPSGLLIAVALAGLAPVSMAAAQSAAPEISLSQAVRQNAEQARMAMAQNNFAAASGYLAQAGAQAQSDGDRYLVATMQLDIANRTFNTAGQVAAINALIASPLVGDPQRADLYYHLGRIAHNAQDDERARTALQSAVERGSVNPRAYIALADLTAQRADYPRALALYDRAVALQRESGASVPDDWYRRAIDIAQRGGDATRAAQISQELVATYPTSANWRDALTLYRTIASPDQAAMLDLWRLQAATGALAGEPDYLAYLRLAHAAGRQPEIERVVLAGKAANMLDSGNAEINSLDRGTTAAAEALRRAIGGRAGAAANQASGAAALAAADDYVALGQYAEAAPLYRMAVEKGGVDADLANERLGMTLALAGDAAGARTALDAVTGDRGWVSRFWRIYVDTRSAPTPVAATEASPGG